MGFDTCRARGEEFRGQGLLHRNLETKEVVITAMANHHHGISRAVAGHSSELSNMVRGTN
jgi:hypothetical protein